MTVTAPVEAPQRSHADRVMRRLLRLPVDGPKQSILDAESVFGKSIAISALRCTITYLLLPLLAPVINLTGVFGPVLGLLIGAVSMVAIAFSIRRFFAADHKWRWGYTVVGVSIFVMLIISGIDDIVTLVDRLG